MLIQFTDIIVGEWYKKPNGRRFEIIALDEDNQLVEIEYFDRTVEEISATEWQTLGAMMSEPPIEYTAEPHQESADYGVALEDQHPDAWYENPLDAIM